jgi:hypothetical protein
MTTSAGGAPVLMSLTIRPMPTDVAVTFVPVSLVNAAARSSNPAL